MAGQRMLGVGQMLGVVAGELAERIASQQVIEFEKLEVGIFVHVFGHVRYSKLDA